MNAYGKRTYNRGRSRSSKRMRRSPLRLAPSSETKTHDYAISHNALTSSTNNLVEISLGNDYNQRIGRKINVRYMHFNLANTVTFSTPTRAILYVPKTSSDILTLTNRWDVVDTSKFWVIKDFYFSGDTGAYAQEIQFSHKFPMGINVEWDGNTSSDITKNNIKLYMHGPGNTTVIQGHVKVSYKDS